jgi:hypothetical protein
MSQCSCAVMSFEPARRARIVLLLDVSDGAERSVDASRADAKSRRIRSDSKERGGDTGDGGRSWFAVG